MPYTNASGRGTSGDACMKLCILVRDHLGCFSVSYVKSSDGLMVALVLFNLLSACETWPFLSWETFSFLTTWASTGYKPDCHHKAKTWPPARRALLRRREGLMCKQLLQRQWECIPGVWTCEPIHVRPLHAELGNGYANRPVAVRMGLLPWVLHGWGDCVQLNTVKNSYKHKVKAYKKTFLVLSLEQRLEFELAFKKIYIISFLSSCLK